MLNDAYILQVVRDGLYLVLLVSAPAVAASLIVGLLVSFFQATTQLQDQSLSFVPKLFAVLAMLAIAGTWMGGHILRFTQTLLQTLPLIR